MISFHGQYALVRGAELPMGRELAGQIAAGGGCVLLAPQDPADMGACASVSRLAAFLRTCGHRASSCGLALASDVASVGQVDILVDFCSDLAAARTLLASVWDGMLARQYGRVLWLLPAGSRETVRAESLRAMRAAAGDGAAHEVRVNSVVWFDDEPVFRGLHGLTEVPASGLMAVAVAHFVSRLMTHTGIEFGVRGGHVRRLHGTCAPALAAVSGGGPAAVEAVRTMPAGALQSLAAA